MKNLDSIGLFNHVASLASMMRRELDQERKHASNPRCKPANWGSLISFIEYAFEISPTAEEIEKCAHEYNW